MNPTQDCINELTCSLDELAEVKDVLTSASKDKNSIAHMNKIAKNGQHWLDIAVARIEWTLKELETSSQQK